MSDQPAVTPELQIRVVRDEDALEAALSIRRQVFIIEQDCPPEEEWDGHDDTSRHLVGYLGDTPVAVARWRAVPHADRIVAKLERFAVLKKHRGKGFGGAMLRKTMEDSLQAGFEDYLLHAQEHLAPFYARYGFEICGDVFMEAGIPHVPMDLLRR